MNRNEVPIEIKLTIPDKIVIPPERLREIIRQAENVTVDEFLNGLDLRRIMEIRVCRALQIPPPRLSVGKTAGLHTYIEETMRLHKVMEAGCNLKISDSWQPAGVIMRPGAWRALKAVRAKMKAKRRARARMRSRGFVAHGRHK